jgi:ammonium transporter, Amt family
VWGNATIAGFAFFGSLAMFKLINHFGLLRVSEAGELEGIDIHEHGAPAYHPEAAFMGQGFPSASSLDVTSSPQNETEGEPTWVKL